MSLEYVHHREVDVRIELPVPTPYERGPRCDHPSPEFTLPPPDEHQGGPFLGGASSLTVRRLASEARAAGQAACSGEKWPPLVLGVGRSEHGVPTGGVRSVPLILRRLPVGESREVKHKRPMS